MIVVKYDIRDRFFHLELIEEMFQPDGYLYYMPNSNVFGPCY